MTTPASPDSIALDVIQPTEAACCGPTPQVASGAETEAEISLGCGNPLTLAALQSGQVVLDLGSGAGADVFPAAGKVGPGGKVIGLDMLEEMLARARATAERAGYTNVEFRQGDAQNIPLEDTSVDVVISNCVINLVQDKGQAFREAYRVLKPGGRLSISDIVTDRPFNPALRANPQSWAACVSGALTEVEYIALVTQAGFDDIQAVRSQDWPAEDGTRVYSLNLAARKPS
jgi:SAM-dependent methyltransferase